jgi:hypothetical protein
MLVPPAPPPVVVPVLPLSGPPPVPEVQPAKPPVPVVAPDDPLLPPVALEPPLPVGGRVTPSPEDEQATVDAVTNTNAPCAARRTTRATDRMNVFLLDELAAANGLASCSDERLAWPL